MDIQDTVRERLQALGYTVTPEDDWTLGFLSDKVERQIVDNCNLSEVPEGLCHVWVDMVVGEFLLMKKSVSPESLEGLDLDAAVKSIREGDTEVSFAVGAGSLTAEQRLDVVISHLLNDGKEQFVTYRRMTW